MERNKKLVFFSVFPPYRGGISKFSNLLAQNISKHVEVVPINFKKQYPKILFPGKTQYDQSIPYKKIDRIGSTFNPLSYGKLSKRIDQEDPDIFMASYWMTFMSPLLSKISRSRSKKCLRILIVHNFIPHESRFFDSYMNRKILNSFDRFIVLSNKVRDEILSMDSSKKVLVIPHPEYNDYLPKIRKEDAIKKIGLDKNKKTILFFGLIRPYKGLDLLIKAFSMLPNDYQLIIAGEVYGKKDKYEQLIDNSKNKNILFTNDFIPENEVHIYFSSADLCVLPYISGTQSGVKAIADYFKVPSLVSNVGGLVEEIQDKKNGFIIHELNEFSISNQIEEIFQNLKKWMPNDTSTDFQKNNPNTWDDFAERVLNFCSQ